MRFQSFLLLLSLIISTSAAVYPADAVPGVPVSVVITSEGKGENLSEISSSSVTVQEDREVRSITGMSPLRGTPTQLLILIDDSAGSGFDTEIPEVKSFIQGLPSNVEVGVGYMRNGMSEMVSAFTLDHDRAAGSIRLPLGSGGADVSPYDSLSDAVKKWPVKSEIERREVIMISSGIEGLGGGPPPENPYVNAGISAAQKAGVVVFAIYNPGAGHLGHSLWRGSWGQNLLSQLADETGGELYWIGNGPAVSFQPYFDDIMKRQNEQYIVTFEARPEKKSGLQPVKIRSSVRGLSFAAPDKVYVKASL